MPAYAFKKVGGSETHTAYSLSDGNDTVLHIKVEDATGGWLISSNLEVLKPEYMAALRTFLSEQLDRNEEKKPVEKRIGDYRTEQGANDIAFSEKMAFYRVGSGQMSGNGLTQLEKAVRRAAYEKELANLNKRYGVLS